VLGVYDDPLADMIPLPEDVQDKKKALSELGLFDKTYSEPSDKEFF